MTENPAEKLKELHNQRILAYRRGEWEQVLEIGDSLFELKANDPLAAHDACVAHFRMGNREQARAYAQRTCQFFLKEQSTTPVENQIEHMMTLMSVGKASSRYMRHYEVLAEILYEEGAFEVARDYFEQLTLLKGKFSRKYIYLMKCYLHLHDYKSAAPLYERMVDEFSGREGHMLISFRDYLSRHLEEDEAIDLYLDFLEQANLHDKEFERINKEYEENPQNLECNAVLRGLARKNDDTAEEMRLLEELLEQCPDDPRAYMGVARLSVMTDPDRGMKSIIRALQSESKLLKVARPIIKEYLQVVDREIQENLCKGLLAILENKVSQDLMLDLSAELPECELLNELKTEWSTSTTEVPANSMNNVTLMLENLSLSELIKSKMRLEEYISSKVENTTFLVSDVVGSTRLKDGVNPENVLVSFAAYHSMYDRVIKSQGGSSFIDEGDGKISRFSRAIDAVRAAREIRAELISYNEKDNKLAGKVDVRIGIHSGQSLIEDSNRSDYKQVADRVLDVSCHLEKYGDPGEIHISQEVRDEAELRDEDVMFLGWREKSGVNVYKIH
jgi:class 3 adenylate cyclase